MTSEMTNEKSKWDKLRFFRAIKPKLKAIKTKYIIVACSVVLLGGAIYLNWLFFAGGDTVDPDTQAGNSGTVIDYTNQEGGASSSEDSYFAVTQMNRQRARDEAIEVYQTVIDSEDALDDIKQDALNGINRIAAQIEKEANIESLIKSKGFSECVAVLSDNNASIIVQSDTLLPNEIAQIKEIVVEQSDLPVSAIKIVEVNE